MYVNLYIPASPREIEWSLAIMSLIAHFTCDLVSDLVIVSIENSMSLLRRGAIQQHENKQKS